MDNRICCTQWKVSKLNCVGYITLLTICLKFRSLPCKRGFGWQNLIKTRCVRSRLKDHDKTTDTLWQQMLTGKGGPHTRDSIRVIQCTLVRFPVCMDLKITDPKALRSFWHITHGLKKLTAIPANTIIVIIPWQKSLSPGLKDSLKAKFS